MPEGFFGAPREWSRQKHEIIAKYLRGWAYKLSSRSRNLAFVDACAGAGCYETGEEGSPLLAAKLNRDTGLTGKGARLTVHACEADPETAERLRRTLREFIDADPPLAVVYESSFAAALPAILEATRRIPTLIFLDPYDNVTAHELAPILDDADRESTEVIVRVDANLLARVAGWVRDKPRTDRWQRTAEAFRRQLPSLGLDGERVRELLAQELPKGSLMEHVFEEYLALFERRFRYRTAIPVRADYFAAPKYYLVHCTNSVHGVAYMNDQWSTTDDGLFRATMERESAGQRFLFEPERPLRFDRRAVEQAVLDFLGKGQQQFIGVRAELALAYPAELREKHHKAIIQGLIQRGAVKQEPAGVLEDRTLLSLA